MEVKEVKFGINEEGNISEEQRAILESAYHTLFMRMYGEQDYEEGLYLANKKPGLFDKKYIEHFARTFKVLDSVQNNPNIVLLTIEGDNKTPLGFGRIILLDDGMATVSDIAFSNLPYENENDLWHQAINFVERYLREKEFTRLYVEIPCQDVTKLSRAFSKMDFTEDDRDVVIDKKTYAYCLNKSLERKLKDESSNHRK